MIIGVKIEKIFEEIRKYERMRTRLTEEKSISKARQCPNCKSIPPSELVTYLLNSLVD